MSILFAVTSVMWERLVTDQDSHYPLHAVFVVVDLLFVTGVVYLMIQHNDEQYQKLIRFFCGNRCAQMDEEEQLQQNMNRNEEQDTIDTRTVNPVQRKPTMQTDINVELTVETESV